MNEIDKGFEQVAAIIENARSISKEFRGKGYGSEGLKLTIEIAKEIVPEEEIYLRVNKDNTASQKVMIKNGAYRAEKMKDISL